MDILSYSAKWYTAAMTPALGAFAAAAAVPAVFWCFGLTQALRLARTMARFSAEPPVPAGGPWPKVSVIVPARNEEADVEAAVRSLLAQDYPGLEVVAVDDRSTDSTRAILRRLAREDARLTVAEVDVLPAGWLGKNNANRAGAARASGEWLLFTDADVKFSTGALRRAVGFAERHRLGHVVALPHFLTSGFLESAFVSVFCVFFSVKVRLWLLPLPRTRAFIGSGTFNMVRREDYERSGGHERLRLEVADDVKLGLILRRTGTRQGAYDSEGDVRVRWQDGFAGTMRGLVKNAFSGLEWRWDATLLAVAGILLVSVAPVLLLLAVPWPLKPWLLPAVLLPMLLHGAAARRAAGGSGLEGLAHPVMAALFCGVMLWSAASAEARDGIDWRGTRYRLAELREGCVREDDYPLDGVLGWE